MSSFDRFTYCHLGLGLVIRLAAILWARYQDAAVLVKYTDIDYSVFTDAARHVVEGESPYLRHTYRYTPLIAWLMAPNVILFHDFGKVLFSVSDIVMAAMLKDISGHPRSYWLWLYNPLSIVISTRGSADSVVALVVVAILMSHYRGKVWWTGALLGVAIHLKLYPVVYAVPLYLSWSTKDEGDQGVLRSLLERMCRKPNLHQWALAVSCLVSLTALTSLFYALYGWDFLQHTYFYHLTRVDRTHNMSPYFYALYLQPSLLTSLLPFLPQAVLCAAAGLFLHQDLNLAVFLQTVFFVTYNKVVTSQYFIWYLSLLPLILPYVHLSFMYLFTLAAIWLFAQGSCLLPAYFLEFQGRNAFLYIWVEGLAFLAANVGVTVKLIQHYRFYTIVTTSAEAAQKKED
ncbi:unnamed protein product [Cyprideis torosa]|uniref:GPI alpha-1,4-mannosyltransferase I, catalytic subunit n=1 Tax=Cyprideis torosa TaxID=163714 RepID=A0A7R8ZQ95_9CRUS|nr:unnamed protein product [Cyprideis torosa]CAG0900841.1 unnamed protein product [Cyprideis torosa]